MSDESKQGAESVAGSPESKQATITFRYRLYTFENGLGKIVYQVKRPFGIWSLWMYSWVCSPFSAETPRQWNSRKSAMAWIRDNAEMRREKLIANRRADKAAKLRLIVKEDIEA